MSRLTGVHTHAKANHRGGMYSPYPLRSLVVAACWTLATFLRVDIAAATTPQITISNAPVMIDMVQNNPGDPVGWEQTKYFDPNELKKLEYTGMTTTGEMSGTQAVDFHTLGQDYFPAGSAERLWLDAYAKGVDRFVARAKSAGIKAYFFVDMIVLPTTVLAQWTNATDAGGAIQWNAATRQLLRVLVNETFARFPGCDGWIVRTGETYVYDTPFHVGNSPKGHPSADPWVEFISFLREEVCVGHSKDLFFRGWDNWPSDASYYQKMTSQIQPHKQLHLPRRLDSVHVRCRLSGSNAQWHGGTS